MTTPATAPPIDAELAAALKSMGAQSFRTTAETLPLLRAASHCPQLTLDGAVRIENLSVRGAKGEPDIQLIALYPTKGDGPWPLLYVIHGGGMVMGAARDELSNYLNYVTESLAIVVAVEYRLAPEHPDPAPIEDCYAGLAWAATHSEEIGVDPHRISIIGSSAGGGLAAGTALLARDRGFPSLTHQILLCPMLDDRGQTHSSRMLDNEGLWDRNDNAFAWSALLGDRAGGPNVSIYAAPARAHNLTGLPRSYIDVGGSEIFRDEAIIYAQRLSEAGVVVDFHLWGGAFHISDVAIPQAFISQSALTVRDRFIRHALEQPATR